MYGWRDAQTSQVKPKTLSPRWYEDKYFAVPRHDAWLRVEVFDKDNQSTDDFLGSVEIQSKDLSVYTKLTRELENVSRPSLARVGFNTPGSNLGLFNVNS